jgi:antirestriction protein
MAQVLCSVCEKETEVDLIEDTRGEQEEALCGDCEDTGLDADILKAYRDIIGKEYYKAEDAQEAYVGQFSDNAEFAQNMAEEIGAIKENAGWPYTCIDWEWAGKELMYDYSESDGYYFRNL